MRLPLFPTDPSMHKPLIPLMLALCLCACAPDYQDKATASAEPAAVATADPAPVQEVDVSELEALKQKLSGKLSGLKIDAVRATPMPGLFEIQSGFNFGYVSADGRFLIEGDLNDLATGQQLTESRRRDARVALVNAFGADRSIEYAPKEGPAKYTVTVFTDIDCGYCRKLHQHIAEYNADGIAVRYLFFPRSGPDTASFHKAEKVWCAADRKEALTQAKLGSGFEGDMSCGNPIMDHLKLAAQLGLRGTPAIILPDGELIPGYQPPDELLRILAEHDKAPSAAS